jgi:hypothetical protein
MTPSRAQLQEFEDLLLRGAISIGGFAEQDFLNAYFKASAQVEPSSEASSSLCMSWQHC